MKMRVEFPGADRIVARYRDQVVVTDQDGSAPAPFELFLVSIATCAGLYVSRFCRQRGIATEGLGIEMRTEKDPDSGRIGRIDLQVVLPPEFPENYRRAVLRAAELCPVKKHMEHPPEFRLSTRAAGEPVPAGP